MKMMKIYAKICRVTALQDTHQMRTKADLCLSDCKIAGSHFL